MSDERERKGGDAGAPPPVRSPFVAPGAGPAPAPIRVTWLGPAGEAPRPVPPARSPWARLRTFVLFGAAGAVAFAIGLWGFHAVLMPRLVHGPGDVVVPDLTGLTLTQAERTLTASKLVLSRAGERFDAEIPRGSVISQDPPEGTPVRGQRRVVVVTSLGAESATVPPLAGESSRTAEMQLRAAGAEPGPLTFAASPDVPEGFVIATDPPADAVLPRGTRVALLVSSGPVEEAWVMPALVGLDFASARREIEALGFAVEVPEGSPPAGPIVEQSPEAGTRVVRTTPVRLVAGGRARP